MALTKRTEWPASTTARPSAMARCVFYVAPGMGKPVAYDLPGGALTMVFTGQNLTPVPDGQGGTFLVGTFDLNITEATGVYQSFLLGHNRMVDILHRLADGTLVEHCYCVISRP